MKKRQGILLILFAAGIFSCSGCDYIYGFLHKPGGEERTVLGVFQFNEYSASVEQLQKILIAFGYASGKADGKFGAITRETVARFQLDEKLEVTRFVDKATWERMQEYLNTPLFNGTDLEISAVQEALKKAGFPSGSIDGLMGKRTRQAVKDFQSAQGLTADGQIGLQTIKALIPYIQQP